MHTTSTRTTPALRLTIAAALLGATAYSAQAQEPSVADRAGSSASSALTKSGHAIHRGATKTGDAIADGASSAGHAIHRGATKTGDAIVDGAESASAAVKRNVHKAHKAMKSSSAASE